ncbi:MAG TPA: zf-HC2 domain-containing protein [Terriglobia bacterium]|jgi:ribosomal protein L28
MNVIHFNDKACEKVRRYFDSYLDNELLVETNHEVLRHLAVCADCTRLLEERGRLKKAVRQAVMLEEPPAGLLAGVQKTIREGKRGGFFAPEPRQWGLAVAALLVLAVGGVLAVRMIGLRTREAGGGQGVFQTISTQAREILRIGLADHVHCTLELGRWKQLLSFDHMKQATGETALGPEFIDLVPVVKQKLGPHFQLIQGHRCTFNGRDYVHLIATGGNGAILSLVITEKKGEAFTRAQVAATMEASGVRVYRDNQDQLEIAGFETNRFLAFVVSNLDRDGNLKVAADLAPSVSQFLQRL